METMEQTNYVAIDIDRVDSSSDNNTINGQANQSNEQIERINLLELPKEILENILIHLGDRDLLTASQVCKLFASVVETAFAQKYSDECYKFNRTEQLRNSFDKVMLAKYGACLRWVSVFENDEEILDLIEQNCHNLERVDLTSAPKMIHLKDLKKLFWNSVHNLLKFTTNLPKIRLNSLEVLTMDPHQNEACVRLLQAFECKQLEELELENYSGLNDNDEIINAICKFKTINCLSMPKFPITAVELEKLAAHLPCLTELSIRTDGKQSNAILDNVSSVLSACPMLTDLTLNLNDEGSFSQFAADAKKSTFEFHGRFADTNTEITIVNNYDIVFTSKDCVIMHEGPTLELHWMANWNEESVRTMMADLQYGTSELKFFNHCAENTVNICAFLPELSNLQCLDIKSDGPITIEADLSRHHKFFPHLKTLKLHLEELNAIDFLETLDSIFCEQIEELRLDTKGYACRDQELKHAHEMTEILTKFKNLKSLHLAPAFTHFDPQHVLLICQNLIDLHVQR